jgi:hypothetical protein
MINHLLYFKRKKLIKKRDFYYILRFKEILLEYNEINLLTGYKENRTDNKNDFDYFDNRIKIYRKYNEMLEWVVTGLKINFRYDFNYRLVYLLSFLMDEDYKTEQSEMANILKTVSFSIECYYKNIINKDNG